MHTSESLSLSLSLSLSFSLLSVSHLDWQDTDVSPRSEEETSDCCSILKPVDPSLDGGGGSSGYWVGPDWHLGGDPCLPLPGLLALFILFLITNKFVDFFFKKVEFW